jgi:hypothetical protein
MAHPFQTSTTDPFSLYAKSYMMLRSPSLLIASRSDFSTIFTPLVCERIRLELGTLIT